MAVKALLDVQQVCIEINQQVEGSILKALLEPGFRSQILVDCLLRLIVALARQ